jgi:predicted phage terminase large subunit-like protein
MSEDDDLLIEELDSLEAELCARSLASFVQRAWPILESGAVMKWNWHLDLICSELEKVSRGENGRLLINVPPGTMKTLLVAVFWPAWEWTTKPHLKFLSASYGMERSTDSARKVRDIVQSEWYRSNYHVLLRADQEAKTHFINTGGGWYMATSTDGRATGEHPDRRIIDDPHNAKQARSDLERKRAIEWHSQTLSTRGASKNAAEVVIMQRLHERDLSGHILDSGAYRHVMLPMRFEPDRKSPGDPRTDAGDLLWPDLFPEEKVRALELSLGQYGVAGQFAQRPSPAGGGLFKREWFKWADARPVTFRRRVRAWDVAATAGAGCYTAGVLVSDAGVGVSPRFYIEDVQRGRWGSFDVDSRIKSTAAQDGKNTTVAEEKEGGSAGVAVTTARARTLLGYDYRPMAATGDKEVRANQLRTQAEAGEVALVRGAWCDAFLEELESFPNGEFLDQVDAASHAFNLLVTGARPVQRLKVAWG